MLSPISFLVLGIFVAAIDHRKHIIPNRLNVAIAISQLLFAENRAHAAANGLLAALLLLIPSLLTHGSIGMGDVKFQFGIGALLSSGPWSDVLISLYIALVLALFELIFQRITKGISTAKVPFGPHLYGGALATFLFF